MNTTTTTKPINIHAGNLIHMTVAEHIPARLYLEEPSKGALSTEDMKTLAQLCKPQLGVVMSYDHWKAMMEDPEKKLQDELLVQRGNSVTVHIPGIMWIAFHFKDKTVLVAESLLQVHLHDTVFPRERKEALMGLLPAGWTLYYQPLHIEKAEYANAILYNTFAEFVGGRGPVGRDTKKPLSDMFHHTFRVEYKTNLALSALMRMELDGKEWCTRINTKNTLPPPPPAPLTKEQLALRAKEEAEYKERLEARDKYVKDMHMRCMSKPKPQQQDAQSQDFTAKDAEDFAAREEEAMYDDDEAGGGANKGAAEADEGAGGANEGAGGASEGAIQGVGTASLTTTLATPAPTCRGRGCDKKVTAQSRAHCSMCHEAMHIKCFNKNAVCSHCQNEAPADKEEVAHSQTEGAGESVTTASASVPTVAAAAPTSPSSSANGRLPPSTMLPNHQHNGPKNVQPPGVSAAPATLGETLVPEVPSFPRGVGNFDPFLTPPPECTEEDPNNNDNQRGKRRRDGEGEGPAAGHQPAAGTGAHGGRGGGRGAGGAWGRRKSHRSNI